MRRSIVVVLRKAPNDSFVGIGKVHHFAVGAETEAIRTRDICDQRVNRAIKIDPAQRGNRFSISFIHSTRQKTTFAIRTSVVQTRLRHMGFKVRDMLSPPRLRIPERKSAGERDNEPAALAWSKTADSLRSRC